MTVRYTIRLENCAFFARHGVHEEESVLGQRFFVDAELTVEPQGNLGDDRIEDTIDYGGAFLLIQEVVTGERRFLIEALAHHIAVKLTTAFPRIVTAKITVRKPNAPVAGILDHVEVTVEHHAGR